MCVTAPSPSTAASCVVLPDYAVLRAGATQRFSVSMSDGAGNPLVLVAGIAWSAVNNGAVSSSTTTSVDFTAASVAAPAADGPRATIGTVSCFARVEVVSGAADAGELAVIVTDELTGRGVSGSTVIATDNLGTTLGNSVTTGANGYAKLTGITGTEVSVTAYSADYNYLTIAGYDYANGSRVLSMVLRRNPTDKYGGQKGTFNGVPTTANLHAGISGMSVAGAVHDQSFTQLVGATVPTWVKFGGTVDQMDVPLPAGVYLGYQDAGIKTAVASQGLAGVCGAGVGGEASILAGTCGTRTAWALSGDIPVADVPTEAFDGGINFVALLPNAGTLFRRFTSSVVRDVEFSLRATPTGPDGGPDFADNSNFTTRNHDFSPPGALPLAFRFAVLVPDVPKFRGTYADGVVILGGSRVPGRGFVPLGVGTALNTSPVDSKTDVQPGMPDAGIAAVRMAPTHHGIEGTDYSVMAVALPLNSISSATSGTAVAAVIGRPAGNALTFDANGGAPLGFAGPFPAYPEGAKYNFSSISQAGLTGRTFKLVAGGDLQADLTNNPPTLVRVAFIDAQEHRWVVFADPTKAVAGGFRLPTPPGGAVDRTFFTGMSTGGHSGMLVQTLRLANAGSPIDFRGLVEANSTNADRISEFTTAFASVDYSRPTVEWKTPTAGGTVTHGGTAVVVVKGFRVGTTAADDGYVMASFAGGIGCTDVTGTMYTSTDKGEVGLTIPSGCIGSTVTMTAMLVDVTGSSLNPPVAATVTATVQ
jgi:hypothetical protein